MLPTPPAPGAPDSPARSLDARPMDTATLPCDTAQVVLAGELDASNCGRIVVDVDWLCRQGFRRVLLRLDAVTFLDAAAIDSFLTARRRARGFGGDVVLKGASGEPLRVLKLVGLDTILIESGSLHE